MLDQAGAACQAVTPKQKGAENGAFSLAS